MDRIDLNRLSDNVKKLIQPSTPSGLKMLAIKGSVPLRPVDYVIFLYLMLFDKDQEISDLASKAFKSLNEKILIAAVMAPLPAEVLDRLAMEYISKGDVIERILMNNSTADETFERIARYADERILDIIANNQVRILRYPAIIKALCENPASKASQRSKVIEFAQKAGVNIESLGLSIFAEKNKSAPVDEPPKKGEVNRVEAVKPEGEKKEEEVQSEAKTIQSTSSSNREELIKKFNIEREYYDESIPLPEEMEKKLIDDLEKMSEERQMALVEVGRHRVKQIMAKSPYNSVALAAVKHPEITMEDIYKIAQDRAANAEAIKYIATQRDYIRVYNIKLKLALNPKTPVPMAMAFVRSLRLSDLKNIAKSAGVSKILQNTAKDIIKMHS